MPDRMQVIVAQMGSRERYAVPVLLERKGMLAHFFTDAYGGKGWPKHAGWLVPAAVRPAPLRRLLARRCSVPAPKVTAFHMFGLRYYWKLHRAKSYSEKVSVHLWAGRVFNELICRLPVFRQASTVFGFNSASELLFEHAKAHGMLCILDQCAVPYLEYARLFAEEADAWRGWEKHEADENTQAFADTEAREWRMSDIIVAPSRYVRKWLARHGVDESKCVVVPLGVDVGNYSAPPARLRRCPIKVLFVGNVCILKGIQYLLLAAKKLDKVAEVRIVGPVKCNPNALSHLCPANTSIVGPVPHSELRAHLEWADVLCLPTLTDSFGMVCLEAMASGVPIITTPNAGVSEIICDGLEGYVVPIRNSDAIAEKVGALAGNPALLDGMSRNARSKAEKYGWEAYGERLATAVSALALPRTSSCSRDS